MTAGPIWYSNLHQHCTLEVCRNQWECGILPPMYDRMAHSRKWMPQRPWLFHESEHWKTQNSYVSPHCSI